MTLYSNENYRERAEEILAWIEDDDWDSLKPHQKAQLAAAHATLVQAEEQHIANQIALLGLNILSTEEYVRVRKEIRGWFGFTDEDSVGIA